MYKRRIGTFENMYADEGSREWHRRWGSALPPPHQMAVMRGRSNLLLMVLSRMTRAMTMTLVVSEYRFLTQAEQRPGRKGKDS